MTDSPTMDQVLAELAAGAAGTEIDYTLFCKNWNGVRQSMKLLEPYLVSHYGVVAQLIIDTACTAGDYVKKAKC